MIRRAVLAYPDEIRRQAVLARIPKGTPERCLYEPHPWNPWGPYVPVRSEAYRFGSWTAADGIEPIKAWRTRICPQCGCEQAENYDRTRLEIVAYPDDQGVPLYCLGTTDRNEPLHPLARGKMAVRNDTDLRLWVPPW